MVIYLVILAFLILSIFLVSLSAYRLYKGNKEGRRIMDRFYAFVAIVSRLECEIGKMSKEQKETLILDIKDAVVGGSVLERLRALDAVMDRFDMDAR